MDEININTSVDMNYSGKALHQSSSLPTYKDGNGEGCDVKGLTSGNVIENSTSEVNKEETQNGRKSDTGAGKRDEVPSDKQIIEEDESWVLASATDSWTVVASFEKEE